MAAAAPPEPAMQPETVTPMAKFLADYFVSCEVLRERAVASAAAVEPPPAELAGDSASSSSAAARSGARCRRRAQP